MRKRPFKKEKLCANTALKYHRKKNADPAAFEYGYSM
jgi:hypothetical protein